MLKLGMIADDFTGANDTAAQFSEQGIKTLVLKEVKHIKNFLCEADLIVIDTESRRCSPEQAYEKVGVVGKALKDNGIKLIYKKMDSTLRGNVGSELDAVIDEFEASPIVVSPAFPANGRVTINGYHFVNLTLLEKTGYADDPIKPVKESHIPTLIQRQSNHKVGHISLSTTMKGAHQLEIEIRHQRESGNEIIVVDALTDEDLRSIAQIVSKLDLISCGSAGLAKELSKTTRPTHTKSIVVISGTANSTTISQILRTEKTLNTHLIKLNTIESLKSCDKEENEIRRVVEKVREALNRGGAPIIVSAESGDDVKRTQRYGRRFGLETSEVGNRVVATLGFIADRIVREREITGLMVIGGDTTISVFDTLGAVGMWIDGEILPGIPVGKLAGGRCEGLRVVTKAGGFGVESAVTDAIKYLKMGVIQP